MSSHQQPSAGPQEGDWVAHTPSGEIVAFAADPETLNRLVEEQHQKLSELLLLYVTKDTTFNGDQLEFS